MKITGLLVLTALMLLGIPGWGFAQAAQEFTDPAGKYKFTLLGDWRAVSYNDAVGRAKLEFVYGDRAEGLLKITREKLNGLNLAGKAREEEENLRMYRAGFERATNEHFDAGPLDGIRFAFYSADGGRKAASAFYYLQDGEYVWVLRFTGRRGVLDTIRNITDRMARSFTPLEK
ncbi:MAG: hypothetical protein HY231_03105 [Acidobacteria bacterium]|nr:hypothetical protein [Acidobacteriota bacterium]